MYIGGVAIITLVLFVIAMVMFVKTCAIMSCTGKPDNKTAVQGDLEPGGKQ